MGTMHIDILSESIIDDRDSAFAQAAELPTGEILCSFCVGGGSRATGGTELARSTDRGHTWQRMGTILPASDNPWSSNHLKLSRDAHTGALYAYGGQFTGNPDGVFGEKMCRPIFCISTDNGRSWSAPQRVDHGCDCSCEVSHGILPLSSGRLLAPAATLHAKDRLGEAMLVAISDDHARTWHTTATAMRDPAGKHGYLEHKLAELSPGRVIAVSWTVQVSSVTDQPDHYAISEDDGLTWTQPRSTGVRGQTMTPIALDDERLLVLYNRRYGRQGIVMQIVNLSSNTWHVEHEQMLYDPQTQREQAQADAGVHEFLHFAFGFPVLTRLSDGTFLATYWTKAGPLHDVRCARLRIQPPSLKRGG